MSPLKKITAVLLVSSLSAVIVLVGYLGFTLRDAAVDRWVHDRSRSASRLASLIDHELVEAEQRLLFVSKLASFQVAPDPSLIVRAENGIPQGVDPARRWALTWLLAERDHGFNVLFVLLPNGDHYLSHPVSVQRSLQTYNLAHRKYFQEAQRTRKPVFSDVFVGADGIPAVATAVPIVDEVGTITSYLGGAFHLSALTRLIEQSGFEGTCETLFVVDRAGTLIASSGASTQEVRALASAPIVRNFLARTSTGTVSGVEVFATQFAPGVPGDEGRQVMVMSRLDSGWTLAVVSDLDVVVRRFSAGVDRVVALAAILLILLSGLGIFLTRRIGLRWQAAEAALQVSHDRLETRVQDRTAELAKEVAILRRTEAALREREDLFKAITNQSCDGLTVADTEGSYTFVNSAFCKMTGYSEAELLKMTVFDVKAKSQDRSSFSKSKASKAGVPFQVRLRRKNGEEFCSEIVGQMIDVDGRSEVLGTIRDITVRLAEQEERIAMERRLLHGQKLESMGLLAGGIAHDFNNLLMAILGNAGLARAELPPASPAHQSLTGIENASQRAAELARQMLAYSGKGRFVIEPINLSELVRETAQLLQVSISKKAKLNCVMQDDLPPFDGDAAQVSQVILNLITNAAEAVGDSPGTILLETGARAYSLAELAEVETALRPENARPLLEGRYVYLKVTDSGCGMDSATFERVFDPFFTTKFAGRGLGMSAVQGIVRGHGGAITVASKVGEGTTFNVLFYASESLAPVRTKRRSVADASIQKFSGTILIADDEPTVLEVGQRMLERLGFKVLCAQDGQDALRIFEAERDTIQGVLLDLTMPRMDGAQAFHGIRRLSRDVPIIICSGYSESDISRRFLGQGLDGFLQKPYNMASLRKAVGSVFGHSTQQA